MGRLFWHLCRLAFQRELTYRTAALAALATNLFFGYLRAEILLALYGSQLVVAGLTRQDAVTYTGLSQMVIAYLSIFGWWEVMRSVQSGDIASDLLKPLSFWLFWLGQDAGRALAGLILRGISLMLLYTLLFPISVPTAPSQWLLLVVAMVLSWLVSFGWRFLVNLAAFWITDAVGFGRLCFVAGWLFSGFLMPLRYYPEWLQQVAALTPFPAMVNTVVEIYLGVLEGPALWWALGSQLLWAIILALLGQLVLRLGVRKLVIQGG